MEVLLGSGLFACGDCDFVNVDGGIYVYNGDKCCGVSDTTSTSIAKASRMIKAEPCQSVTETPNEIHLGPKTNRPPPPPHQRQPTEIVTTTTRLTLGWIMSSLSSDWIWECDGPLAHRVDTITETMLRGFLPMHSTLVVVFQKNMLMLLSPEVASCNCVAP